MIQRISILFVFLMIILCSLPGNAAMLAVGSAFLFKDQNPGSQLFLLGRLDRAYGNTIPADREWHFVMTDLTYQIEHENEFGKLFEVNGLINFYRNPLGTFDLDLEPADQLAAIVDSQSGIISYGDFHGHALLTRNIYSTLGITGTILTNWQAAGCAVNGCKYRLNASLDNLADFHYPLSGSMDIRNFSAQSLALPLPGAAQLFLGALIFTGFFPWRFFLMG